MSGTNGKAKSEFITQCCECKRVWVGGIWTLVEGLVEGTISHGYCPECYAAAMDAAEEYLRTAV
jgi:hypothetical protein